MRTKLVVIFVILCVLTGCNNGGDRKIDEAKTFNHGRFDNCAEVKRIVDIEMCVVCFATCNGISCLNINGGCDVIK